jgi:hypothetical protein
LECNCSNNSWLDTNYPGAGKQLDDEVWAKLQDGWQGTNWINEMTKRRTDSKSPLNITGGSEDIIY